MKTIFTYIFLLTCLSAGAQNLVFNPGFEKHERLPCNKVMLETHEYENVIWHWSNPTQATPDVWSTATGGSCEYYAAHTKPHGGQVMAGIKAYSPIMNGAPYAEYIQAALRQPLVAGKKYRVECWVSLDKASDCAINNLGFHFAEKKIRVPTNNLLDALQPQLVIREIIETAPGEWRKISGTFIANKAARYLVIGVFNKHVSSRLQPTHQAGGDYIYYYFDDVVVTRVDDSEDEPVLASAVTSADHLFPPSATAAPSHLSTDAFNKPVLFAINATDLSASTCAVLDEIVQQLQKDPDIKLNITGHTDREGAERRLQHSGGAGGALADACGPRERRRHARRI